MTTKRVRCPLCNDLVYFRGEHLFACHQNEMEDRRRNNAYDEIAGWVGHKPFWTEYRNARDAYFKALSL